MPYQFFNDVSDETAFYVMELKGEQRKSKLGITSFCYYDEGYAKQWRDNLVAKIDATKSYYNEVVEAIDDIYLRMLD